MRLRLRLRVPVLRVPVLRVRCCGWAAHRGMIAHYDGAVPWLPRSPHEPLRFSRAQADDVGALDHAGRRDGNVG